MRICDLFCFSTSSLFLLLILSLTDISSAYIPQCKCIRFNSTDGGRFHSPDFPNQIEHIDCLFFHFEAPPGHIVQIIFDSFSLPPRNGICSSSLRIYDHTVDGLIEPTDRADYEFCAREITMGRAFYSKREHLLLQILHANAVSKGFNGEYRFLPKVNFTSDAIEIAECTYRVEKAKGKLFSSLYPYHYPSNVNCTYVLPHQRGHQIVITSSFLNLGSDAILEVYEMNDGKHLLHTATSASKTFYTSCASSVLIYFKAGLNDVEKASGFVLDFQYEDGIWSRPGGYDDSKPECLLDVNSTDLKTGSISSNDLGRGSSLPTKCRISLIGYPNERISIQFTKFNLYVPENKNIEKRCIDVDHITVDVRVDARLSRIDEWCGANTPPQIMSSSNLLQIEYTTKSSRAIRESSPDEIGFAFDYKFHTDWNMDHMQAKVDANRG
ncbi:hypothetical protein WR25_11559 [Diploscapter pachys]|uniref:CUB domain-containing protein n=1 Tax=Diploscapter pachys TaxID=2018661 RepID=A0A2A2JPZ7_9BILA|nr:hypothetical protein WR25_11559 [Diploscapter pachys]